MSGTKGMLHYRKEEKAEAVRLFLEEHITYAEIGRRLGIRKSERIEAWVRKYRQEGEASFNRPIGRPRKAEQEMRELERLRMEVALLKKFRTELRNEVHAKRNIGLSITIAKNTK